MKKQYAVLTVLALALSFAGCAARQKTVTNLPAGVSMTEAQQWDSAVAKLDQIASATSSARQIVIDLNKQGIFPDSPSYAMALQILGRIDLTQLSASNLLKSAPSQFSAAKKTQIQALMLQISQQLTVLNSNGVTGIKDPNSLQQVTTLINNIGAAVTFILSL